VADTTYTLDHDHVQSIRDFEGHVATDGIVTGWWGFPHNRERAIVDGRETSYAPAVSGYLPGYVTSSYTRPKSQTGFWYADGTDHVTQTIKNGSTHVYMSSSMTGGFSGQQSPFLSSNVSDVFFQNTDLPNPGWDGPWSNGVTPPGAPTRPPANDLWLHLTGGGSIPSATDWEGQYHATVYLDDIEPDSDGKVDVTITLDLWLDISVGSSSAPATLTYRIQVEGTEFETKPSNYYVPNTHWPGGRNGTGDGWVVEPRELVATLAGHTGEGTDISIPFNDPYGDGDGYSSDIGQSLPHAFLTSETSFGGREFSAAWKHDVTLEQGDLPTDVHSDGGGMMLMSYGAFRLVIRTHNTTVGGEDVEYFTEVPLILRVSSSLSGLDYTVSASIGWVDEQGVQYIVFSGSAVADDGIETSLAISNDLVASDDDNPLTGYGTHFWTDLTVIPIYGGTLTITPA